MWKYAIKFKDDYRWWGGTAWVEWLDRAVLYENPDEAYNEVKTLNSRGYIVCVKVPQPVSKQIYFSTKG